MLPVPVVGAVVVEVSVVGAVGAEVPVVGAEAVDKREGPQVAGVATTMDCDNTHTCVTIHVIRYTVLLAIL